MLNSARREKGRNLPRGSHHVAFDTVSFGNNTPPASRRSASAGLFPSPYWSRSLNVARRLALKLFIFVMSLLLPDGSGPPPYSEPMPSLEACLSKVAEVQQASESANETFKFMAGCVQVLTKANPA